MKTGRHGWLIIPLVGLVALFGLACNSETDDAGISDNLVTVAAFDPLDACADVDGELIDLDGDGTEEQVFVDTVQAVTLQSRLRKPDGSPFSDVIFDRVDIRYDWSVGTPPPDRTQAISVTVPAGGTTTVDLETILAQDTAAFIDLASRGDIRVTFNGRDASGEPVKSATGATPLNPKTECQ